MAQTFGENVLQLFYGCILFMIFPVFVMIQNFVVVAIVNYAPAEFSLRKSWTNIKKLSYTNITLFNTLETFSWKNKFFYGSLPIVRKILAYLFFAGGYAVIGKF